jgi:hypothetical protein
MRIVELNIDVEDVSEFNDVAEQLLTAYCEELESKGMTRTVHEDEKWYAENEGISFFWLPEASKLIEAEINRLYSIGVKYFGRNNKHIYVSSRMYIEP